MPWYGLAGSGESLGDWYGIIALLFYGVTLVGILFLLWVTGRRRDG